MKKLLWLASVVMLGQLPAGAAEWSIDTKHSGASFSIKHMMVSNVRGSFGGIKGKVDYDGKDLNGLKVDADIDVKTVNTNEPGRDEHLRGADFFDVSKYPTMTFKSKSSTPAGKGKFKLIGDLTMHGVTKQVVLDVDGPSPAIKDMQGNERMGAVATTRINRKDFGIEYNKVLDNGGVALGEEVDVTLDIEMTRKGS